MAHQTADAFSALGQRLTLGQLRQLQWIVPRPWAPELAVALSQLPMAGAKVQVTLSGRDEWIGFFDGERMVEESLRPAAYPLITARGCLPIAGCGRRGAQSYLVEVGLPSLPLWVQREGQVQSLDVGLLELWEGATAEPRVQLRRRIPEKGPRSLAKTTPSFSRTRTTASAVCRRTLPLFG